MRAITLNPGTKMPSEDEISEEAVVLMEQINKSTGRFHSLSYLIAQKRMAWILQNTDCAGIVHLKTRQSGLMNSFVNNVYELWERLKKQ